VDEEGDEVTIACDEDMEIMQEMYKGRDIFKVIVDGKVNDQILENN